MDLRRCDEVLTVEAMEPYPHLSYQPARFVLRNVSTPILECLRDRPLRSAVLRRVGSEEMYEAWKEIEPEMPAQDRTEGDPRPGMMGKGAHRMTRNATAAAEKRNQAAMVRAAEAVPRDRMGVVGLKTTREQWSEDYGIRAETFKARQASRMSPEPTEERR